MEYTGMPLLQVLLITIIFLSVLVEIKTGGMGQAYCWALWQPGCFLAVSM